MNDLPQHKRWLTHQQVLTQFNDKLNYYVIKK